MATCCNVFVSLLRPLIVAPHRGLALPQIAFLPHNSAACLKITASRRDHALPSADEIGGKTHNTTIKKRAAS
jgi:hypothetical protein